MFLVQLLDTAELPVMQEPTAKPIHSKEGDSALMTCVVRNLGDHTVLWKTENKDRQGLKVLTAAESRITADRRFEVLHDKGKKIYFMLSNFELVLLNDKVCIFLVFVWTIMRYNMFNLLYPQTYSKKYL